MFGDAGSTSIRADDALDRASREAQVVASGVALHATGVTDKQGDRTIEPGFEILGQPLTGFGANEDGAVFLTLAAHAKLTTLQIDMVAVEIDQFTDAQTRAKE